MTTEKRLTRSRLKELEEVCSPSKKLKISNESKNDCVKCKEKSCTSCVENHNTSSSNSGHTLVETIQVKDDTPTEHCNVHPTNIVDVTCRKHDKVGCAICGSTSQSSCSNSVSVKQQTSDQHGTFSADNKQSSYRIKCINKVNIKLKGHRNCSPDVWSMCILNSGNVLLADYKIPALSMLDHKTYKVKPVLSLPATSHSMCKVNNQEVVVALSNNTLQFVSIQDEFILTRSIQLDHICLGIDVVLDQIYVTDGRNGNIFIYDLNGEIITKIANEPNGNKIFSWNRFITVNEGGDTMHVTDREKGVITLDREGNVIWGYTETEIIEAFGICKDGKGNLFVTGRMSNNVALLSQDGAYKEEVIPSQRCVGHPEAVCFDILNSKLYVSGDNRNKLYVYTLH